MTTALNKCTNQIHSDFYYEVYGPTTSTVCNTEDKLTKYLNGELFLVSLQITPFYEIALQNVHRS